MGARAAVWSTFASTPPPPQANRLLWMDWDAFWEVILIEVCVRGWVAKNPIVSIQNKCANARTRPRLRRHAQSPPTPLPSLIAPSVPSLGARRCGLSLLGFGRGNLSLDWGCVGTS